MEAVIDLGESREVRRVGVDCLRAQEPWIFLPRRVEVSVSSNGEGWVAAGGIDVPLGENPEREAVRLRVDLPSTEITRGVRFLRVHAQNLGRLPDWHPGSPENAWLFVDEIVVEGPGGDQKSSGSEA